MSEERDIYEEIEMQTKKDTRIKELEHQLAAVKKENVTEREDWEHTYKLFLEAQAALAAKTDANEMLVLTNEIFVIEKELRQADVTKLTDALKEIKKLFLRPDGDRTIVVKMQSVAEKALAPCEKKENVCETCGGCKEVPVGDAPDCYHPGCLARRCDSSKYDNDLYYCTTKTKPCPDCVLKGM